jgi:hypothetical protein
MPAANNPPVNKRVSPGNPIMSGRATSKKRMANMMPRAKLLLRTEVTLMKFIRRASLPF